MYNYWSCTMAIWLRQVVAISRSHCEYLYIHFGYMASQKGCFAVTMPPKTRTKPRHEFRAGRSVERNKTEVLGTQRMIETT